MRAGDYAGPMAHDPRSLAVRLLDVSGIYGATAVPDTIGYGRLVVIGLVGRARRLVAAIHHAHDAGDALEAQIFLRALVEYAITIPWMVVNPELHISQWRIEDIRLTLQMDEEVRQHADDPILTDENRAALEALREELMAACGEDMALPNVQTRADVIGLPLLYSLAYRYESKSGIHPTSLAAEQLILNRPEIGMYEIRGEPPEDLNLPDAMGVSAALLLVILEAAQEFLPELPFDEGFDEVKAEVLALAPLA